MCLQNNMLKGKNIRSVMKLDQLKIFSKNYKPIRAYLWFLYKFTENNYHWPLFTEFIKTQKRYSTPFDKMSILA